MRRVVLAATVAVIAALAGAYLLLSNIGNPEPVSEEESLEIAREFVKNSPTFRYDGMQETLEHVRTLYPDLAECLYCWEFVFTFECTHSGYGDRAGKVLLQVITPHTAHIAVAEGEVVSATLDEKWDMMKQEMIPS